MKYLVKSSVVSCQMAQSLCNISISATEIVSAAQLTD